MAKATTKTKAKSTARKMVKPPARKTASTRASATGKPTKAATKSGKPQKAPGKSAGKIGATTASSLPKESTRRGGERDTKLLIKSAGAVTPAVAEEVQRATARAESKGPAPSPATLVPVKLNDRGGSAKTTATASTAQRADLPPERGYTLLVDGHFKRSFASLALAQEAAGELKSRFPILRIEIYDAARKVRLAV